MTSSARRDSQRRFAHDQEFREFAREALPSLLKGAYLLLHDVDLAEDVVQATMLRVFRHWADARTAPQAYSRRTLINVCRDYWRRQNRRPKEELREDPEEVELPVSFSQQIEDREALAQALRQLTPQQREVLVLRYYFGFSTEQTADILKLPTGTVKSATHRGLEHLRSLLDPPPREMTA